MGQPSILHPRLYRVLSSITLLLLIALGSVADCQTTITSALSVPLLLPSAIVFDAAGNLYLAETANQVVRKVDSTGHISTIAGSGAQGFFGDNGPAAAASLDSPQGLALETATNDLYIADTHNHRIRKVNLATGVISSVAGAGPSGFSGDNGSALIAKLNLPTALAFDSSGNLYVADTGNHRIRRIDASTGLISSIAGSGVQGFSGDGGLATAAAIDSPTGLAVAADKLYLADTHNHRVRVVSLATGIISTVAGTGALGFSGDSASALNSALALPEGLTVDSFGNLFLADRENHRIRRIDAVTGIITTVAGDGTQGFSGDDGPAVAAALDSPRAVVLPSSSLLTIADTGNERIRQLAAAPAAATEIHTIAGLGVTVAGALTISAPAVIAYGSGQVVAALSSSTPSTGSIVFLNTANALNATLGVVPLVNNTAALPTAKLPAGAYNVTATYAGDQTHLSAESPAVAFEIAPQLLTATVTSTTNVVYGQPVPALTAGVTGILPQDAGTVTAFFSSAASSLSPGGSYPIAITLSGPAAGNYTAAVTPPAITISPAASYTAFSNLVASAASGSALTFTAQIAGAARGTLTGTVTLLDGFNRVATVPLSGTGIASFSNLILGAGVHSLTVVYSGDADFASSTSSSQQVTIGTGEPNPPPPTSTPPPVSDSTADFTIAAAGVSSQTISTGTSASFTFTVQPQGAMSSPVTLAAAGLPNLATASFNPPIIPPNAGSSTFTLTIATPVTVARNRTASPKWAMLVVPLLGLAVRRRRTLAAKLFAMGLLALGLLSASGCGNRVNLASSAQVAASKSYSVTVSGTATGADGAILQHSTVVTLIVQPAS